MSYWFNSVASPAAYKKRIQALPPSLDSLSKSTSHWGKEQLKAARVLVVARNLRDLPVTTMPSGADQLIQEVRCLLDKPDATSHAAKQLRRLLKGPDLDDVSNDPTPTFDAPTATDPDEESNDEESDDEEGDGEVGGGDEHSTPPAPGTPEASLTPHNPQAPIARAQSLPPPSSLEFPELLPRCTRSGRAYRAPPRPGFVSSTKQAACDSSPIAPLSRLPTSSPHSEWMSTGSSKDLNLAPETLTVRFVSAFIQEALLWLPGQDSKDANPVVTFDDASAENRVSLNRNINIIIAAARQYMMFLQVDISDDYKMELINRARRHDAKFNEFIKVSATQWFDLTDPHHRRLLGLAIVKAFCATGGNRIGALEAWPVGRLTHVDQQHHEMQLHLPCLALEKVSSCVLATACELKYDSQLRDSRLSSDVGYRIDRVAKAFPTTPHVLYLVFGDGIASRVVIDAPGRLYKLSRPPTLIELAARLHAAHQGTSRSELAIRRDTLRQRGAPAEAAAAVAPAGVPATSEVLPLTDATNKDTKSEGEKPGQARAPRERRERGPPADGIASKTKVMVANLPYDLTEVPWRLFPRHQSPDPIPTSTGALTNHLNARHAAATSNHAIPDMPLTSVLLAKRRHLVKFSGEEAQATAALSEGLSDRTEVAMQWQPSGHLIIGARSAREIEEEENELNEPNPPNRQIRAPGPDSQLVLNDFVSIIRGSSIDTVTNVGMASISGDGDSGVVAAAVVGTESDGVACALRQFLSKSRHGFYLEKPFLEFKCQPPTFAAIAFANNLVTDIIVNIISLMHLHHIAHMRLLPPAPAATATANCRCRCRRRATDIFAQSSRYGDTEVVSMTFDHEFMPVPLN
ncbi:hypothetical protein LZ32DRAFT_681042 [Colletotrichum eremochloae]|nr:hypothetical protein LZ32DRAFT_681042 [Colletotrichum eremochloae]